MAVELAAAYVSIIPETSKIAPEVTKALTGVERSAEKQGKSFGGRLAAGIGSTLKKGAVTAGVGAGAALGGALTKGVGRLTAIEMAEAKLTGLGNSASDVATIMKNANAAVKGTAYGLDEAATTAAMAVASGIKPGAELEQVLKTTADTAGIAGASMSEMGAIFGSVAARGKLQGDDLLQLTSRGIPVLQMLGKELGVTAAEVSDMVSKGQIDFKTFERALRAGVGGSALEAGKTVRGSLANMGAAAGRLGATLAGPFYSQAAGAFTGVTDALDSMNDRAKPVMDQLGGWVESTAIPALKQFGVSVREAFDSFRSSEMVQNALAVTGAAFVQLKDAAIALAPPIGDIVGALGKASAALGVSGWQLFASTVKITGAAAEALAGPLGVVADFMSDHPGLVTAAVAAWAGFKTIPGLMSQVAGAFTPMQAGLQKVRELGKGVGDLRAYFAATGREVGRFDASMALMATSSNEALASMGRAYTTTAAPLRSLAAEQGKVKAATMNMAATVGGVGAAAMTGLKNAATAAVGVLGGPWGVAIAAVVAGVTGAISGLDSMNRALDEMRGRAASTTDATKNMFQAMVSGTAQADVAKQAIDGMTHSMEVIGSNGPNWFHRGLLAIEEHTYGLIGLETEYMRTGKEIRHASDSASAAEDALKSLGLTNDDLTAAVQGSSASYGEMRQRLLETGRGGEYLVGEMDKLRAGFEQAKTRIDELGPAGARAAQTFDELANKTLSAEDAASKLRYTYMELRGINLSAQEAAAALTEEIDRQAQATENFAGVQLQANGQLDATTTAGAALHNALDSIGDSMQRSVASGNNANQVFSQSAGVLEQMRLSAGLSESEWQRLLDTMGMTPEQLQTVVRVQTDEALMQLQGVSAAFSTFSGTPITKMVAVRDEEARAKLQAFGFQVSAIDQATGTARVTVNDQAAIDRLNAFIMGDLARVDQAHATPSVSLDTSGFMVNADVVRAQLQTIDLSRPFPWANLDISQLSAAQVQALNEVGLLDGQTPTPAASMNIDQLTAEQQAAMAKVFDLDSERPTPWASLTKDELDARVNDAHNRLNALDSSHAEPTVRVDPGDSFSVIDKVRIGLRSLPAFVTTTIRQVFTREGGNASGGIAGYAAGGRLPVSGPGTHEVDGILGVDGEGMPVARVDRGEWVINRRSSQKHHALLAAINRDDPRLEAARGVVPGYVSGGVVSGEELRAFAEGQAVAGQQAARSLEGAPYDWGGVNWGDCSGAMSALARFAVGMNAFAGRFATGSQRQALLGMGFSLGLGGPGDFRIGWFNGGPWGGHTAGTLPDGTNVEMGGGRGNGQIGGPAAGANDPSFTDHAFLPMGRWEAETVFEYGDEGWEYGGNAHGSALRGPDWPSGHGVGDPNLVPLDRQASAAADRIESATGGGLSSAGASGQPLGAAESWSALAGGPNTESAAAKAISGQVADALNVFGIPDQLPPVVKAGQQWYHMVEESSAKVNGKLVEDGRQAILDLADVIDPDTAPAGVGLHQAAASHGWAEGAPWDALNELKDHWDKPIDTLPDYVAASYDSPDEALAALRQNGTFDAGGTASGIGHLLKNTIKPERILSPEQTKAFEDLVYHQLPRLDELGPQLEQLMNAPAVADIMQHTGAVQSMLNEAMPMIMSTNSLSEWAGSAVSGAVRAAGTGLTSALSSGVAAAGKAASSGLQATASALPPGLEELSPLLMGASPIVEQGTDMASAGAGVLGHAATELAAWYSGEVASGVVGAVEGYTQEVFGATPMGMLQDTLRVVQPVVGGVHQAIGAGMDGLARLQEAVSEPVATVDSDTHGGNVYNFNAVNVDQMMSYYRRETAKHMRGVVGAR